MTNYDDSESFRVASGELKAFIERIEALESEKADIADMVKEVFAEMKASGYDVKAAREILKIRKSNPDDVAEQEAIIDMYKEALNMK